MPPEGPETEKSQVEKPALSEANGVSSPEQIMQKGMDAVLKQQEALTEVSASAQLPDTETRSLRFGKAPDRAETSKMWEGMNADQRRSALFEGAKNLAEKKEISMTPEQTNRLAQLDALQTLTQGLLSTIEKESGESGGTGFVYMFNKAFDTFRVDPHELKVMLTEFVGSTGKDAKEILVNGDKPMPEILGQHTKLMQVLQKISTSTFFGIEVGSGFDFTNIDCTDEAKLDAFRIQMIKMLRNVKMTGGQYTLARKLAYQSLGDTIEDVYEKDISDSEKKGLRTSAKLEIYPKFDLDKMAYDMIAKDPNMNFEEAKGTLKAYRDALVEENFEHRKNELVMKKLHYRGMTGRIPEGKKEVYDQLKDSLGVGAFDISDENWDLILSELAVNAPLIILSGGVASGVVELGGNALSFGARAVIGAERIASIVSGAGKVTTAFAKGARFTTSLATEGAVFELTNAGLHGEWLGSAPNWGQRILWSSAALGLFKGAGKFGDRLLAKKNFVSDAVSKIKNPIIQKAASELVVKGHLEVAAMLTLGAAQHAAYGGSLDELIDNFGEELFHAYISVGALKTVGIAQKQSGELQERRSKKRAEKLADAEVRKLEREQKEGVKKVIEQRIIELDAMGFGDYTASMKEPNAKVDSFTKEPIETPKQRADYLLKMKKFADLISEISSKGEGIEGLESEVKNLKSRTSNFEQNIRRAKEVAEIISLKGEIPNDVLAKVLRGIRFEASNLGRDLSVKEIVEFLRDPTLRNLPELHDAGFVIHEQLPHLILYLQIPKARRPLAEALKSEFKDVPAENIYQAVAGKETLSGLPETNGQPTDVFPLKILGAGGFGQVRLIVYKNANGKYVSKLLKSAVDVRTLQERSVPEKQIKNRIASAERVLTEEGGKLDILSEIGDHPNIMKVQKGIIEGPDGRKHIIVEKAGDFDGVRALREGNMSPEQVVDMFRQIGKGLKHLHENGLMHQDLKLGNVMYDKSTDTWKIIDFGTMSAIHGSKTDAAHKVREINKREGVVATTPGIFKNTTAGPKIHEAMVLKGKRVAEFDHLGFFQMVIQMASGAAEKQNISGSSTLGQMRKIATLGRQAGQHEIAHHFENILRVARGERPVAIPKMPKRKKNVPRQSPPGHENLPPPPV